VSPYQIEIKGSKCRFPCAANETILHAALKAGIGFPYECSSGGCGTCQFQCVSGTLESIWPEAPGLSERARRKGGRMLGCQTQPRSASVISIATDDRYSPKFIPVRRSAVLTKIQPLTHDISEFTLETSGPANFLPGQYALLGLPGVQGARAYSMSNLANQQGCWRFVVKRKVGGCFTEYLFDRLIVGGGVDLAAPYGTAFLDGTVVRDLICIAGGSGISPILSILRAGLAGQQSAGQRFQVFYGGRSPRDIVDPTVFPDIAANAAGRVSFHPAISDESSADAANWQGHRGFIHNVVAECARETAAECEIFLAGPPPMIARTLTTLDDLGVAREQIHFDTFI
jgi:toluene monooxygenase electron transfer component